MDESVDGRTLGERDLDEHEVAPRPRVLAHPRHVGGLARTRGPRHHVPDGRGPGLDQVTSEVRVHRVFINSVLTMNDITRVTNDDGRASNFLSWEDFRPGTYKMHFATGQYFKEKQTETFYPYAEVIWRTFFAFLFLTQVYCTGGV